MDVFGMLTGAVGLALRPSAVELIVAGRGLRGVRLTQTARIPVSGPEERHIIEAIRAAIEGAHLKTKRVAVSIPNHDVLFRFFTLPPLPRGEWETAIKYESRKYIPFPTDELVWDFHVVEEASPKQLAVVFAGVRKDHFTRVRQWLTEAGVEPLSIEPHNLGLARVVAMAYPRLRKAFIGVIELDEGSRSAHIAIVKDRLPYLARDVSLSVAPELHVGLAPQAGVWIAGAREAASGDVFGAQVLSEFRLSLEFFMREYPAASITRLLIYGDESVIAPWCQQFMTQLPYAVEVGKLPLGVEGVPGTLPPASSVGTALQALNPLKAKLDFLSRVRSLDQTAVEPKGALQVKLLRVSREGLELLRSLRKPLAAQAVVALAVLALIFQMSSREVKQVRTEMAAALQLQASEGLAQPRDKDEQALEQLQQLVDKKLAALRGLFDHRIFVTEKLATLAQMLPDGFWLEGFTYETDPHGEVSLILRGACYLPERAGGEFEIIGEFSNRMKADSKFFQGFETAQLDDIVTAEDALTQRTYRTFRLTCASGRTL